MPEIHASQAIAKFLYSKGFSVSVSAFSESNHYVSIHDPESKRSGVYNVKILMNGYGSLEPDKPLWEQIHFAEVAHLVKFLANAQLLACIMD